MNSQSKSRPTEIWLIHSVLLGISFSASVISDLLWSTNLLFGLLNNILWVFEFTLIAFVIIKANTLLRLEKKSLFYIILIPALFSIVASVVAAVLSLSISLAVFWHDFYNTAIAPNNTNPYTLIFSLMLGRTIFFQPFIFAWIFIYISMLLINQEKDTALRYLRVENRLKEAQLNSLASQLNPHFLFNTLNNIKFMTKVDPEKSGKMLTALSEVLRYSLDSARQEKVSIRHEMDVVQRYLMIMKIQLEERLDVNITISEHHKDYLIPPMSIHMLVENAIKHGLENIQDTGQLNITTDANKHHVTISVFNDLPAMSQSSAVTLGIGLANITERLNLLYGDEAKLRVQRSPEYFIASLYIPLEKHGGF